MLFEKVGVIFVMLWCTSLEVPDWLILSNHSYILALFIVFGLFLIDATTITISDSNTCPATLKNCLKNTATFLNVLSHRKQLTSFLSRKLKYGPLLSFQLSFRLVRIFVNCLCFFTTVIYLRLVRFSKFLNALLRVCYRD